MIGLLLGAFTAGAQIVGDIKEDYDNEICKKIYAHPDGMTYTDARGKCRLISNNHIATYTYFHQSCLGDYVLIDIETNQIICNLSLKERNKEMSRMINMTKTNNRTTFLLRDFISHLQFNKNNTLNTKFNGEKFHDIDSDNIFVIRKFNEKYYYINIKNGYIERETDYSKNNLYNNGIDIIDFNKKQQIKMETYNFYPYCAYEYDVKYY